MIYIEYSEASRFGNWMFQYAVVKSRAKGGAVAFYVKPSLSQEHVDGLLRRSEVLKGLSVVRKLPPDADVLRGIPQWPSAFDERLVKTMYAVPPRVDEFIRRHYASILNAPLRVSIHVRRGDYLKWPHRHPFVGRTYLQRAVSLFPKEALFVVTSDDLRWCRAFFPVAMPERRFVFVEGGDVLSDLYMATYCHHNIMSNSTFSWWGAYLNSHEGKRVILPSHWYGIEIGSRESQNNVAALRFPGVEVLENDYETGDRVRAVMLYLRTRAGNLLRAVRAM